MEAEELMSATDVNGYMFQAISENPHTVDLEKSIGKIRERLTGLLAEEGDFFTLLNELESNSTRLQETEAEVASQSHELEAAQAELDARKSLIDSLRKDAERSQALEAQLKEKRDVISKLEGYIDRHVSTISELQQSVVIWKEKYVSFKSTDRSSNATTTPALPKVTEEASRGVDLMHRTPAKDMRRSQIEALLKAGTKITTNP